MATYLISYDLGIPETSQDYKELINSIQSLGHWAKPHYSIFLVKSNFSARIIRNRLSKFVDRNDSILVVDITNDDWASWNLTNEVVQWMHHYI
jgi:hypothetical protein